MQSVLNHSQALSLEQLAEELQRQQETKLDYVADTRRVGFFDRQDGEFGIMIDGIVDGDGDGQEFLVSSLAHEHIGYRVNIPKRYYDRMRRDAPSLLTRNVEHWLYSEPEKRMFRTLDGKLRAVLSDRYRRLDNFDLAQALLPEFASVDGLEFHVASLTPERMYIRATLPRLQADVKVGDTVQAGVEISNSEVGSGALMVRPYLLRLVCLNGMVTSIALRKYHSGARVEETEDALGIFSDETRRQDDKVIFMKAADMVRAALTEARFEEIVETLRRTASTDSADDPVAATRVLTNTLELTEQEGNSVLAFLASGGDLTQWGAINALTETAKKASSFDRLVELEALAGKVAEWSEAEWNKVAVAA